jgi:ADP-ribose pyrophosphatase YjhB (NUDIX family)
MLTPQEPQWLQWARRLQAIAQNGITYATQPFDLERYHQVQAVAAEMMAAGADMPVAKIEGLFAEELGYATPKVDTRGVVFRDEGLLLVREAADGRWSLPGGWADLHESPSENVVREIFEESGFRTRVVKLLAVYDRSRHPHVPVRPYRLYKLFFRCEIVGGEPRNSIETSGVGFFREDDLPEISVSRVTPGQIARMFEHYRNPDLPPDFD